jgi:hypothetical protein
MHRCQWRRKETCVSDVIDAYNPDIIRDPVFKPHQALHHLTGSAIVRANERIWLLFFDEQFQLAERIFSDALDEIGLNRKISHKKSVPVAGNSRFYC